MRLYDKYIYEGLVFLVKTAFLVGIMVLFWSFLDRFLEFEGVTRSFFRRINVSEDGE
jgi:hypothetical protein